LSVIVSTLVDFQFKIFIQRCIPIRTRSRNLRQVYSDSTALALVFRSRREDA